MIKVAIVDDHVLFRKSLRMLVDSFEGVSVVIDASSDLDFFEQLQKEPIDLLLLDIQMGGLNGYDVCKLVRKEYPAIKVLMVSQLTNRESIQKVMDAGAHGFFTKNSDPQQLAQAIKSITEKDFYFAQELGSVIKEVLQYEKTKETGALFDAGLSKREIEVIEMACREYSSSEIGDRLFINVRTVETHRKRIMEKTNSKNFLGSILYAIKNNLVQLEEI
jgi:two-component system response regulator DegU